jgi:ATP-binding cassette subfamily B protein RaxB
MNARVRGGRLLIWQGLGSQLVAAAEQVLFLGVGVAALLENRLTLGVLFAFMTLRGRLAQAVVALFGVCQELYLLKVHVERLSDIVMAEAAPLPPAGGITRPVRGSLHARNLSFRYPGGPWIVRDFSCVIQAGESVVITGASGCGKTTLLRLLSTQLPAEAGQLLVDGRELSLWHTPALRRQFSLVLQEDSLFRGSLAENIAAFDPEPDLGRVRDAAVAARIWDDIERMPMRLETPVGDMGSTLSGGQRQRLTLARALYRRPKVLCLDEATSHLDVDTEARVLDHVDALGITVVSVAHRPDVVRRAGRVIRLGSCGVEIL